MSTLLWVMWISFSANTVVNFWTVSHDHWDHVAIDHHHGCKLITELSVDIVAFEQFEIWKRYTIYR